MKSKSLTSIIFFLVMMLLFKNGLTQNVGINATGATPDNSAILDVAATNKGLLIPRVSLISTTDIVTIPSPITSLLVYNINTGITGVGANGVGFYYWNTTNWIKIQNANDQDADWFKIGTTTAPNAITDSMFHLGDVAIGKNTIGNASLDIDNNTNTRTIALNNTSSGAIVLGVYSAISGSSNGSAIGSDNTVSNSGTGIHTGTANEMIGVGTGEQYGVNNTISNSGDGTHYGIYNNLSNTGNGDQYGTNTLISNTGTGTHYANFNYLTGTGIGEQSAVYNVIDNSGNNDHYGSFSMLNGAGSGIHYGEYNFLTGSGIGNQYGNYTTITNTGNGKHYGASNLMYGSGTGNKYGTYDSISQGAGGKNFGMFSSALDTANDYAGFFRGKLSIGMSYANNYILPTTRGTNGQIMRTDGNGNVSWVDSASMINNYWTRLNDSLYPTTITNNIGIGTTSANSPLTINTTTTDSNAIQIVNANNNFLSSSAIKNYVNSNNNNTLNGLNNTFTGTGFGLKYAINNTFTSSSSGYDFGMNNNFNSSSIYTNYGMYNSFNSRGPKYGMYNVYGSNDSSSFFGLYNYIYNTGNVSKYGTYTYIGNTKYGSHYGNYNYLEASDSATSFGAYNEFLIPPSSLYSNNYGTYNRIMNNSSGIYTSTNGTTNAIGGSGNADNTGTLNFFFTTGGGDNTGVRNSLTSQNFDNTTHIGVDNYLFDAYSTRVNWMYGVRNYLSGNGAGRWIATLDSVADYGTGEAYGNKIEVHRVNGSIGTNYGVSVLMKSAGSGISYGNRVDFGSGASGGIVGNGTHYGYYTSDTTSGTGIHYGNYVDLSGAGSNSQYGTYTDIGNTNNGAHYGSYLNIDGNGSGLHRGYYALLAGTGTGQQRGFESNITNTGSTNHYGVYSTITGGTAVNFGLYSDVTSGTGNINVGLYASGSGATTNYAAIFNGNVVPNITSTSAANGYSLGTASFVWRDVYCWRGLFNASDIRFKDNIKPLPYGLKEILKLNPITYTWKADAEKDKKYELGLSSQQVLTIIPEMVNVGDDSVHTLMMNYSALIPVLVKAIQEQQQIINQQNISIEKLKAENKDIQDIKTSFIQKQQQLTDLQTQIDKINAMLGVRLQPKEENK